ncbi:hypothetical protein EV200_101659 [Pedobacter psychrotolerans]|nr:hypothetical protein [Pedobacter psychrotolerans]TCO31211.1 hypothetical protein EV200_101659 [Pedobacter psychrotolerans]
MQPFNVQIKRNGTEELYTVLPREHHFEIMVNDKIVGTICHLEGHWVEVPANQIESGQLPVAPMQAGDNLNLQIPIDLLGQEIERIWAGMPEPEDGDKPYV